MKESEDKSLSEEERISYQCQECQTVPSLKVKSDANVDVKCECHEGNKWSTSLDEFFSNMITKEEKEEKVCEGNHKKFVQAQFTCKDCGLKFCLKCLQNHIHENKTHQTNLVENFNHGKFCEVCKNEEIEAKSFCIQCGIQMCADCAELHKKSEDDKEEEDKEHRILDIEDIIGKRSYISFNFIYTFY